MRNIRIKSDISHKNRLITNKLNNFRRAQLGLIAIEMVSLYSRKEKLSVLSIAL